MDFAIKNSIFAFLQIQKSRAQELSNDVSFVIFGHQTWDLEGGGQIDHPPSISWFSSTPAEIGIKKPVSKKLVLSLLNKCTALQNAIK